MSRIYTTGFDDVQITAAAQDIFSIQAGSANPLRLHEITLEQREITAWESKPLRLYTVSGSPTITGGTSLTPRANDPLNSVACSATVKSLHTTVFTGGTSVLRRPMQWNLLNGLLWLPAPEDRIEIPAGQFAILQLPTQLSAASKSSLSVVIEEF